MSNCSKCKEPLVMTSWDIDTGDATWICHNCRQEYRLNYNGLLVDPTPATSECSELDET